MLVDSFHDKLDVPNTKIQRPVYRSSYRNAKPPAERLWVRQGICAAGQQRACFHELRAIQMASPSQAKLWTEKKHCIFMHVDVIDEFHNTVCVIALCLIASII